MMKESHLKEECDPEREEVTSSRKHAIASTPLNEYETKYEYEYVRELREHTVSLQPISLEKRVAPAIPMFLKHCKGVMRLTRDKYNTSMKHPDSFFR